MENCLQIVTETFLIKIHKMFSIYIDLDIRRFLFRKLMVVVNIASQHNSSWKHFSATNFSLFIILIILKHFLRAKIENVGLKFEIISKPYHHILKQIEKLCETMSDRKLDLKGLL